MLWPAANTDARGRVGIGLHISSVVLVPVLLMLNVMLGCAAILSPMKPGANDSIKSDEGLVLGRIQLTDRNGVAFESLKQPFRTSFHVQWRLKDQKLGKEFMVDALPKDGPFAVKLPTGSYQLTELSFDTALGIWQASLPTTFTVSSRVCTYLGTWELRTEAGFFDGSIVRHVVDQHNLAENDLKIFMQDSLETSMVTELSSSMASPLVLTSRTQGTDLTSPP